MEGASERGKRVIAALVRAGSAAGLTAQREYPVVGGRIDVVWLWHGPDTFPVQLPLVGFEVESSWRTRKHIKGDYLNLADLQPALAVIVLLGDGEEVEATRKFARVMIDRYPGRFEIWTEEDVTKLATETASEAVALVEESGSVAPEVEETMSKPVSHTGKYRALAAWLAKQSGDEVRATFAEIEEVLGFPLPPSSRKFVQHWHGYEGSAVARAVADAGWGAQDVNLTAQQVTFVRR